MTGPEHYAESEELLALAEQCEENRPEWAASYLQAAQVHATLALAASNVIAGSAGFEIRPQAVRPHMVRREIEAWLDIAGTPLQRSAEPAAEA